MADLEDLFMIWGSVHVGQYFMTWHMQTISVLIGIKREDDCIIIMGALAKNKLNGHMQV